MCPKGDQEDFSNSFMYSVHQMNFLVAKRLEHILLKHESITFSQFIILVGCKCPRLEQISQQAIARELDLTEATVSRHIATLVKLNYMRREEDPNNRRKHILSITPEGTKAFEKAKKLIDKELSSLFASIEEKDRKRIMEIFSSVLQNLSLLS